MKKILFGLAIGLLIALPAGVIAHDQINKPNVIYLLPRDRAYNDETISVFDDAGNKCYVIHSRHGNAISCVRANQ